jgi:poly(beta-D-mannuronate) C5 epimerase
VITISCDSTNLTGISNEVRNKGVLNKQSSGVWFLNASLVIAKGAILHIDSADTNWLRINSDLYGNKTTPNAIDVHGSLKIDSIKVTSCNPVTNSSTTINGLKSDPRNGGNGVILHGTSRPFIIIEKDAVGTTDITNSEIAYLGYGSGTLDHGSSGLSYYGGEGSVLRGNNIHDLYFGFYSSDVGRLVIENNQVHHNTIYGFNLDRGSHDTIIRNNVVHDNGQYGIICSLNCNNVTIENNTVYRNSYKNVGAGIMFDKNMTNSIARNNNIHNEGIGIFMSDAHNNEVYNNSLSDSEFGINVASESSGNIFYSNTVKNPLYYGIYAQDPTSVNNTFYNNQMINSTSAINSHNKVVKTFPRPPPAKVTAKNLNVETDENRAVQMKLTANDTNPNATLSL